MEIKSDFQFWFKRAKARREDRLKNKFFNRKFVLAYYKLGMRKERAQEKRIK